MEIYIKRQLPPKHLISRSTARRRRSDHPNLTSCEEKGSDSGEQLQDLLAGESCDEAPTRRTAASPYCQLRPSISIIRVHLEFDDEEQVIQRLRTSMAPGRNAGRNLNHRLRGFVDRSHLRKLVWEVSPESDGEGSPVVGLWM
ncbi:hypothetical protein TIFTF001_042612 [Ficus carica]|uniref:Uncharacterized protein n=1 Tax=Ficus carica TaxID=3494 RepID=A0AA88D023_FICCA|nr:hypothetical protein TIFTF001_042612 [Ficus carica]